MTLACLTALLAVLVARRTPTHTPLTIALVTFAVCALWTSITRLAFDVGAVSAPAAAYVIMGAKLGTIVVSAWAVGRTFAMAAPWWVYGAAWALGMGIVWLGSRAVWVAFLPAARGAAALVEGVAWCAWRWSRRASGIPQQTAAIVVACDVLGFALEMAVGRERLPGWGILALVGTAAVQALWLASVRVVLAGRPEG